MILQSLIFLLLILPFSDFSTWESPATLFHSLKATETEGDYLRCFGLAMSPASGHLFFSDESLGKIFRIFNGEVHLVAGTGSFGYKDGPFLSAQFGSLTGMAFGPNGSFLLVADFGNHVIRMLDFEKGLVSTIAGVPKQSGMVDGIKGRFNEPFDIVVDSSGKIAFVTDYGNNRIRKIDLTNWNVTTVAGTGLTAFNGNEGPAIKVNLYRPISMIYQESSNRLFFTDGDCAVRMVNGTGYLNTIFRDCTMIPRPWGIVEKDNTTILVSDDFKNVIVSVNIYTSSSSIFAGGPFGGFFDGSRLEATFSSPIFMTADPWNTENVYISDYKNAAIRKISKAGFVSTEVKTVGSGLEDGYMGQARFSSPTYLALDENNSILYVSDTSNHAIRRIYLDDNYKVDVLTGKPYGGYVDGSLDTALFSFPRSLLLDQQNNGILYVCDSGNLMIRAIHLNQKLVKTTNVLSERNAVIVLKDGIVVEASSKYDFSAIYSPYSAIWINDDTMVASISNLNSIWLGEWKNDILDYTILAGYSNYESGYKDGEASIAKFSFPIGLASFNETIFIADSYNYVIRSLDMNQSVVSTYFGSGKNGHRNGPSFMAELKAPYDIKMDSNGTLYIVDEKAHAIRMIKDGIMETIAGFGASVPQFDFKESVFGFECLARISESRVLLSDKRNNVIFSLTFNSTANNNIEPIVGSGMIGLKDGMGLESMLKGPTDLAFSSRSSILYIADSGNHAIRAYDMKSGYLSTLFTSILVKPSTKFTLQNPQGIALDTVENKLFIADTDNNGIKVLDLASNNLTLLAGSRISIPGFRNSLYGEIASFSLPIGIAVSTKDKVIFVCDSYNHAIRKVSYNGTVTTLANINGLPGYLDGNLSHSRMLYPTRLALSSSKTRIYILDSGNYRIRMIDLKTETMSTVLDTKSWPINNLYLDDFDNLFVNNKRSIRLFKNIQSTTTNVQSNSSSNVLIYAILLTFGISILAFVTFYLFSGRKSKNVTEKLAFLGQNSLKPTLELTATLSVSRTVAISLPGHLCMDKSLNQISFEDGGLKSGGTAKVIKGKFRDPEMISKNGIVDVAIKVVNANEANKQAVMDSFRYEVALMAALPESPYLIKLIGYCLDPMVIVMKYYGMNLQECLDSKQFFTSKDIKMKAMRDIVEGMRLVHSKDIIHFDLKPGNILLDSTFQFERKFVICDFGFADFTDEAGRQFAAGLKRPTVQGITVRYAAPELLLRTVSLAHPGELKKVDVYAFSMIAYYIAFGNKPWGADKLDDMQTKVLKSERPSFPEGTDKEMKDLIQRCWHQDPQNRPTFMEILDQMNTFN